MPKGDREILKADPDDGTTPVSNLLLEAGAVAPLSGVEKGALMAFWRLTYGCTNGNKARKTHIQLSAQEWARLLNTHQVYAGRIVQRLVNKKILNREDLGQGIGYRYSMNTKVNEWLGGQLSGLGLTERFRQPLVKQLRGPTTTKFTPANMKLATPKEMVKKNKRNNLYTDKYKRAISDDPDKYIKGKYGHMVRR